MEGLSHLQSARWLIAACHVFEQIQFGLQQGQFTTVVLASIILQSVR